MPLKRDFTEQMLDRIQDELARRLLRAAAMGTAEHMKRVSTSAGPVRVQRKRGKGSYTVYTNPSKPGEYPHLRTGHGRAATGYEPTTVAGVRAAGLRVKIGVRPLGKHMLILELHRQRLGILKTFTDLKPQLAVEVSRKAP